MLERTKQVNRATHAQVSAGRTTPGPPTPKRGVFLYSTLSSTSRINLLFGGGPKSEGGGNLKQQNKSVSPYTYPTYRP